MPRVPASVKNPWVTTTWERAQKRTLAKANEFAKGFEGMGKANFKDAPDPMQKVRERVMKQHPELSKIKAYKYARTKDKVGRQIMRMRERGMSNADITKKLGAKGKRGSSGKSSG